MSAGIREFVSDLREAGELVDLHQPVDLRHMATLVDQSDKALMFHNPIGYDMPVLSGVLRSANRAFIAMGSSSYRDIEKILSRGLANPIEPTRVSTSSTEEVILTGDEVNLFDLPVPIFSVHDGGPMITAGIVMAKDPELGVVNTGCYRFMVKEKALTGIDIVTPNNLRYYANRAYEAGRPLPISISIGTHPIEMFAANYRAPIEVEEMSLAGGIRGQAVALGQCRTIDLPYIADCEIVLEAEILPVGWTQPEGRFGEFTFLMGGLHWNPNVRVKSIMMRRDAMYWALHMPFEYTYLGAAALHQPVRTALTNTGIEVKDINITVGGAAYWHAVISIKKQAGEGKSALLAALSVGDLKHVVIVDEEIDVYNPLEVEWAIATRVQGDRDVMIIPGARAKPLDPSLFITPGHVPTGTKVGIDATIGENIPKERYERVAYAYADRVKVGDYVEGKSDEPQEAKADIAAVAQEILAMIEPEPMYYTDIDFKLSSYGFRNVAAAFGELHAQGKLWKDKFGRVCLRDSEFAAKP
ncbi:carboxylyase [Afifella sp. IM 167]|nr:carboxylyase [Afifella sp. IM 167]